MNVVERRHACATYTFPPNDALYHVSRDVTVSLYLKPARKSGAMIGAVYTVNAVNTVNTVNIANVASIVNFSVMRYKKQYNDSPKVLV